MKKASEMEAFCYAINMNFQQLIEQARAIRAKYAEFEINRNGK